MAAIDSLVQISITSATTAVATESFAIPLILGPSVAASGAAMTVKTYSAPSEMLADGFDAKSAEYIWATALCSQTLAPAVFKVAPLSGNGIAADIEAADGVDPTWYGLICPQASDADILAAATQLESMTKLGIFASATADIGNAVAGNVAAKMTQKSLTRSLLLFSPTSASTGIDAAWAGGQLPQTPGSNTWAYKSLYGQSTDTLTATQEANCIGVPVEGVTAKGQIANIYQSVGGVNITQMGQTPSGMFADFRIGLDSLRSMIKTNILQAFVNNQSKIAYTEDGCAVIESCIRAAISTHIAYGFLDGNTKPIITHTPVASVPATTRQQRLGPPFTFTVQAAGALHAVAVQGQVNI